MKTKIMLGIAMLALSSLSFAADKPAAKSADKAPAAAAQGPSDSELQDQEKAIWEAFKNKDADGFKKFFAAGYQGVYSDGVTGVQGELDALKKMDVKSYTLSDVKVTRPTLTSALVTYKVDVQAADGKRDVSGSYYTTSLWAKRGNKYLTLLHTEAKAEKHAEAKAEKKGEKK